MALANETGMVAASSCTNQPGLGHWSFQEPRWYRPSAALTHLQELLFLLISSQLLVVIAMFS